MGILSQDLDKTARRFVREAVYGIMASQSVMLTEIERQQESRVCLKKIEERFSRQLIKPGIWDCLRQIILFATFHFWLLTSDLQSHLRETWSKGWLYT